MQPSLPDTMRVTLSHLPPWNRTDTAAALLVSKANQTRAVVIDQSETCTPEQDDMQVQCLRELPAESYEVLEGEDVQMRCRVAHQRGKAQWRARNFLLGYKRSIPSWPRYSMQGDPRLGVHDLVITNVTHEDAGTYECQVSPVAGQSPLRRQTTLSILVKPSQPVIVAASGEPQPAANGRLTVPLRQSSPGELNQLRLYCQSHGGSPEPKFEWFHNGVALNTTTSGPMDRSPARESMEPVSNGKEDIHSAQLIMDKESLKTGDRLVCLISNKATLRSKTLSQQKLRAELLVVIQSPPGNPEIIDWSLEANASKVLTSGMPLEATCRAAPAGNPPGELLWRWESGVQQPNSDNPLDKSPDSAAHRQQRPIIIPISSDYAIQQFADEKLLSKVRIPKVNATQHGLDLVCAVKHQIGPEKSTRIPILVRYEPESVHIHGPEETIDALKIRLEKHLEQFQSHSNSGINASRETELYVYPDRPQYLLCSTSPYYDRAQIRWYGLLNITAQWLPIAPLESFTRVLEVGQKNFVLASMIQLVSTNSERTPLRWTSIRCVTNSKPSDETFALDEQISGSVSKLVQLKSYFPPGIPVISGHKQNTLFQEGTNISLNCEARAGNPPGELVWLNSPNEKLAPNEKETTMVIRNETTTNLGPDGMIRSTLTVQLSRKMNGRLYRCASENRGFPVSDERTSDSVQLSVAFAATSITMTVADETGRQLYPRDSSSPQKPSSNHSSRVDSSHNPPVIVAPAGSKVAVQCQMDLSNPRPKIHWRLYRCSANTINMNDHFNLKELIKDCVIESVQGTDEKIVEHNIVQSQLVLALNWSHHGDIIECFAETQTPWAFVPDQSSALVNEGGHHARLRDSVLMNVRFPPLFLRPAQHLNWPVEKLHIGMFDHHLPQYIVVDGGTVDLDLEPSANPEVTSFTWYRDNNKLIPVSQENEPEDERVLIHNSRLRIRPVQIGDMANYTLIATNSLGTSRFRFFLNVTYGPQLIGQPRINITATGRKAQLECQARANPTPSENAVRWRRLSHSFAGLDPVNKFYRSVSNSVGSSTSGSSTTTSDPGDQQQSMADSVTGIPCNKGTWANGFKYFAKCWNPSPGVLASSLTIYDLGPSDVGSYQCHMDNAVGSPAVRIIDLIYPFAPQIIPIPRWAKAAPDTSHTTSDQAIANNGDTNRGYSQARLTCVIAAEPMPTVEWVREPSNLTLVEGGQFRSQIKTVRPGLYHAVLYLSRPREVDMGKYYCKATNLVGEDVGHVELGVTTSPDLPNTPRLLNATSTTLAVAWTQGFNGGPVQKFKLRWATNEHPDKYMEADVPEDFESETIAYEIKGLQKATSYRVAVSASNEEHGTTGFTQYLLASTTARDPTPDKEAMHDEARAKSMNGGHWDAKSSDMADSTDDTQRRLARAGLDVQTSEDRAVVIIIAASIFGSLVLIANLLIIVFLAQRRRKKLNRQRRSSMFMGSELVQLCPNTANPYGGDMTMHSRPSYNGYLDGASINDNMLLQNPSGEHFMAYHSGMSPVAMNLGPDVSNMIKGSTSFTESPHPSLQAINPLGIPSPIQMDYNVNGLHLPTSNLAESDLTAMSYLNTDTSPPINMTDYSAHPAMFAMNEMGLNGTQMGHHPERRTPLAIRMNSGMTIYPAPVVQRMDSPNSGAASSISATRSSGYPNSNSLERNGYFVAPRTPSQNNTSSLARQTSFGQATTTPNGTFARPLLNYGQTAQSHQVNSRSGSSTFTPTHNLANGRMRTNPMAMSYYAERGPGSNSSYGEKAPSGELTPSMGTSQLIRRGSYNAYKTQNASQRMNTSQLLDTYLQRYNDQLQSVRAMNQRISPARYLQESDGSRGNVEHYRSPVLRPNCFDVLNHSNTESTIIPPPNAFESHSPHGAANTVTGSVDGGRPLYQGSDIDEPTFMQTGTATTTATVRPSPSNLIRSHQLAKSNALVKHPTPDQALIFQNDGHGGFARYGCIV